MTSISQLLFRVKHSSIMIGALYSIAFLLLLPIIAAQGGNVLTMAKLLLVSVVAVLVVHFFLNFTYVITAVFPILAGILFLALGGALWLGAPFIRLVLEPIFTGLSGVEGLGAFSGVASLINAAVEVISRFGEMFLAFAGAIWWAVGQLRNINQGALVVYMIFLTLFGMLSGFASLGGALVFLVVWLAIYLKLQNQGEGELRQELAILLKLGASLVVVFGLWRITNVAEVIAASKGSPTGFFNTRVILSHTGESVTVYDLFTGIYRYLLGSFGLALIWQPTWLLRLIRMPDRWTTAFMRTLANSGLGTIYGNGAVVSGAGPAAEVAAVRGASTPTSITISGVQTGGGESEGVDFQPMAGAAMQAWRTIPAKVRWGAAGALALIIVGGLIWPGINASLHSPARTAVGFFEAVNAKNAAKAASYLAYPQAETDFATKEELTAQLGAWVEAMTEFGPIRFHEPEVAPDFKGRTLTVHFSDGVGVLHKATLRKLEASGKWGVVLPRQRVSIQANAPGVTVEIDGTALALVADKNGHSGQVTLFANPHVVKASAPYAQPLSFTTEGDSITLNFKPEATVVEEATGGLRAAIGESFRAALGTQDLSGMRTPTLANAPNLLRQFEREINGWKDATLDQVNLSRFQVGEARFLGRGLLVDIRMEVHVIGTRPVWWSREHVNTTIMAFSPFRVWMVQEEGNWVLYDVPTELH